MALALFALELVDLVECVMRFFSASSSSSSSSTTSGDAQLQPFRVPLGSEQTCTSTSADPRTECRIEVAPKCFARKRVNVCAESVEWLTLTLVYLSECVSECVCGSVECEYTYKFHLKRHGTRHDLPCECYIVYSIITLYVCVWCLGERCDAMCGNMWADPRMFVLSAWLRAWMPHHRRQRQQTDAIKCLPPGLK